MSLLLLALALGAGAPASAQDLDAALRDAAKLAAAAADAIPAVYRTERAPTKDALGPETFCRKMSSPADRGLDYCANPDEFREFALTNAGSPRVNAAGGAVRREYEFSAPQGARQELGVLVYDWGCPDAGDDDSACSMMTELLFFPRKVLPALRPAGPDRYEAVLPTGETVVFDAKTKEIVGGALAETGPIDANPDRHARRFAALRYDGRGIMVRSDQRGDTPRSAVVWGQKKLATVFWRGKTCRVSPAEIWVQNAANEGGANRWPTDDGFYAMLRAKCGWIVAPADLP